MNFTDEVVLGTKGAALAGGVDEGGEAPDTPQWMLPHAVGEFANKSAASAASLGYVKFQAVIHPSSQALGPGPGPVPPGPGPGP